MSLEAVRRMYVTLNGDHPMSEADDDYVRRYFVPVPDTADFPRARLFELMADGQLPLPSYLLSDGTPMVHPDYLDPVEAAGSVEALHDWFVGHWSDDEQDAAESEWSEGYLSGQYVCLWSVTPTTIKAKTEAIESIKSEIEAFGAGTGSQDRLRRAVDRLDTLEPPFTRYDLLRFGGPTSRQVWIDQVRARYLAQSGCVTEPVTKFVRQSDRTKLEMLARKMHDSFNQRDPAALDDILHAQFWSHPLGGGVDAVKASREKITRCHPHARSAIDDLLVDGDRIAIRSTTYGIGAEGDQPTALLFEIARVQDGKIIELWGASTQLKAPPATA